MKKPLHMSAAVFLLSIGPSRILTQRQRQQFRCPFQILLVDDICHPNFLQAHTRRGVKPIARSKHDRLIAILSLIHISEPTRPY